jgi:hypothetical protein
MRPGSFFLIRALAAHSGGAKGDPMFSKALTVMLASLLIFALSAPAWAQALPKNSTGEGEVFASDRPRALTPFEQFADRLKLDAKTQAPQAAQIFSDAAKEAAPLGQQMLQLRQRLVNLALENKAEEMKPVQDAYAATAAKMAGIEASAFAKVYATLKPNQQSSASQAFAIMAGMFQPAAPRGGTRGQRGGGER